MSHVVEGLVALIRERLRGRFGSCTVDRGQVTIEVAAEHLREVCLRLRDEPEFGFDQLMDLCGVDFLDYGCAEWETSETASGAGFSRGVQRGRPRDPALPRFAVVYHLLSLPHNRRLRVRVYAPGEPPRVESVIEIWNSANWFEREAFDLFGILFEGHPDLRRLLTDYGFVGHPFRKDFPLIGEVEMRYDPEKRRVVYEPVKIEPRTLVPKVIRRGASETPAAGREGGAAS